MKHHCQIEQLEVYHQSSHEQDENKTYGPPRLLENFKSTCPPGTKYSSYDFCKKNVILEESRLKRKSVFICKKELIKIDDSG